MKKILALILTIALSAMLFTGCTGTTVVIGECTCPVDAHTETPAPAPEAAPQVPTEEASVEISAELVKTGLAVSTNISESANAAADADGVAKYDITLAAVTVDENGVITVTLANLSADGAEELELRLQEQGYRVLEAKILCADEIGSYNTFDEPDLVCEKDFCGVRNGDSISLTLPAASVVALRLSK